MLSCPGGNAHGVAHTCLTAFSKVICSCPRKVLIAVSESRGPCDYGGIKRLDGGWSCVSTFLFLFFGTKD